MNNIIQENKKEVVKFKDRTLGEIDYEKNRYVTHRNINHFFKIFNGFGCSIDVLNYLEEKGIENFVIIYELDNRKPIFYITSVSKFLFKGKEYKDESSYGINDKQLVLDISNFEVFT